jgi:Uridine phosphorylase
VSAWQRIVSSGPIPAKLKEVEITTTSTGIGGPSTAIATEELARCGARVLIRVGTCGAYVNANIGDLAILKGAIRNDGTTREYVKKSSPRSQV